jgi:hypothetical protein
VHDEFLEKLQRRENIISDIFSKTENKSNIDFWNYQKNE